MTLKELRNILDKFKDDAWSNVKITFVKGVDFDVIEDVVYCNHCDQFHFLKEKIPKEKKRV